MKKLFTLVRKIRGLDNPIITFDGFTEVGDGAWIADECL